jgi:hypothetical protein
MAPLYSLKPADSGWLVYEVFTRKVLVVDGREQVGLTEQQAESIVVRLNYIAVEQLVSSTADADRKSR